tara:strand:+ start:141 stop:881 length:741 start_codon:yes stop_codon:yes gene_type:complete
MSSLETRKIEPLSGTTVTLGAAGDAVTLPTGVTLKTNTVKDAGGNTLFTSDGSGTLSSVNSGLSGSFVFISSQTASSSTSIEFTSGIDSTYKEYVFYYVNIHTSADRPVFRWAPSINGGSSYGVATTAAGTHAYHRESDSGTANVAFSGGIVQSTSDMILTNECNSENDSAGSGELRIYDPSNTTYVKHWTTMGQDDFDGSGSGDMYHGFWKYTGYVNTTSAVNAIRFQTNSGTLDSGTIYLYGIK